MAITDMVDPYAHGVSKALSKLTFGTLAGDADPIAALFQIRHSDIDKRMKAKEAAANPPQREATPTKRVEELERDRSRLRARASMAGVASLSEDRDTLAASGRIGKQSR